MGGEQGEQVGNQSNQGGLGGWSGFQNVVRIRYDGFLWGNGVETRVRVQSPGRTILGGSGGYGQFGTELNWWIRWEIGVDGVGGGDTNGVGCWLNGWVVYRGGFPIRM
jgi:hypothetical protein